MLWLILMQLPPQRQEMLGRAQSHLGKTSIGGQRRAPPTLAWNEVALAHSQAEYTSQRALDEARYTRPNDLTCMILSRPGQSPAITPTFDTILLYPTAFDFAFASLNLLWLDFGKQKARSPPVH